MKKHTRWIALFVAVLFVLPAVACKLTDDSAEPSTGDETAAYSEDEPAVTIGGEYTITRGEFVDTYNAMLAQYVGYGMSAPTEDADIESMQNAVLDMLIDAKILQYQAGQMGIALTEEQQNGVDADVEDEMQYYLESFRSQAQSEGATDVDARAIEIFNEQLSASGMEMDMEGYRNYIKEELTKSAIQTAVEEKIKDAVEVTEDDAKAYYDDLLATQSTTYMSDDKETYLADEENYEKVGGDPIVIVPDGYVRVKSIMVSPESELSEDYTALRAEMETLEAEYGKLMLSNATANAARIAEIKKEYAQKAPQAEAMYEEYIKDAREKAGKAVSALEAGESFDDVLKEYGEDEVYTDYPIFAEKGLLMKKGVVSDTWTQEMVDAVSALENGQTSPLIQVEDAFYILQLVGDEPAGERAYADVADEMMILAHDQKAETEWTAQQEAWRNDPDLIVLHEEVYRDVGKGSAE